MGELARRGLADADQPFQARSLLAGQGNLVLGHDGTPLPQARTSPELQAKQFPATHQSKSADLLALFAPDRFQMASIPFCVTRTGRSSSGWWSLHSCNTCI